MLVCVCNHCEGLLLLMGNYSFDSQINKTTYVAHGTQQGWLNGTNLNWMRLWRMARPVQIPCLCFFCCLFITVTWWYVWCFEWASGNQEEVQACLVTLWLFIISCYSLHWEITPTAISGPRFHAPLHIFPPPPGPAGGPSRTWRGGSARWLHLM